MHKDGNESLPSTLRLGVGDLSVGMLKQLQRRVLQLKSLHRFGDFRSNVTTI